MLRQESVAWNVELADGVESVVQCTTPNACTVQTNTSNRVQYCTTEEEI